MNCFAFLKKPAKAGKLAKGRGVEARDKAPAAPPSASPTPSETDAAVTALMDQYVGLIERIFPVESAMFGLNNYPDEIFDISAEQTKKKAETIEDMVSRISAIDKTKLVTVKVDDFEALKGAIDDLKIGLTTYDDYIPASQMGGAFASFHLGIMGFQTLENAQDAENLKKRLLKCHERFGHSIDCYRLGVAKGITLPAASIDLLIDLCGNMVVEDPAESVFHKSFKDKIVAVGLPEDFLLDTIRESVVPAYKAVKEFLETEYKSHARANAGIFGLPDYERVYNDLIFTNTSVRYTADELHQKGLDEVARIRKRMEAIKDKVFEGTLAEFFVALKDKERFPQLHFANADEEAVPAYKAMIERIDKKMPQYFNKFPKFPCAVEAVPKEAESSMPIAYYMPGTADKPGTFFANILVSKDAPNHSAMALTLHEAIPGHHHQVSLALEMPVPHVFHKTLSNTAFDEGWGLYAEYLGEEMGMYDTDFDLFGRLEMEMHRALRLVVDTGLHTKGWTIEKCVEYMRENLSMSDAQLYSEVKRYAVIPGQALAYKVGEIKILELRKKAEDALGGKFDIRTFHDVVIDHGSVRLDVLEKNVDEWIASVKAQFPEYFEFRAVMDQLFDMSLKQSPVDAPSFGVDPYPDEIFNSSISVFEERLADLKRHLASLHAIDAAKLTAKEREDLEQVASNITALIAFTSCHQLEIPASHMWGGFASFHMSILPYQSLESVKDAENYKKRLLKCPERFGHCVDGFRIGIKKGVTLPVQSIDLLIKLCSNMIVEDPAESVFHKSFKDKIVAVGLPEDFLLDTIRTSLVPAYKTIKEFLETEYKPHARANAGIYGLPDYERVYSDLIKFNTTTDYTADELHQKGLEEVARIRKRMEAIKDKVFDGTLKEFLVALKDKERFPQLFFADPEKDAVPHYEALIERIDKKMPQFFNKFPKFKCAVKAVPKEAEASAPIAYYMPGTADKPGAFFTNILQSKESPNHTAMALTLHEAIPGHHHQVSLALELPMPHDYFKTIFYTAFDEGWGLYAEYLGEEMGMYDTDFDLFGRLEMEMFRALRLVVDTGLHTKGWTIEKCVEYMQDNLSMSDDEVLSEVKRYAVIPGQALAYKVGEIKIREIRKKAEDALGDKFDIRAFHDVVIDHGSVRLDVLEKNVDEWIASVKAQFPEYFELRWAMDEIISVMLKNSPVFAVVLGIQGYEDEIFDVSAATIDSNSARIKAALERVNAIDATKLGAADQVSLELVKGQLSDSLLWETGYLREIPSTHMFGSVTSFFDTLKAYHTVKTAEDAENLKKRLSKVSGRFAEVIERFREGLAKGITLPAESISLMIGKLESFVVEDPAESLFHKSFKDKIVAVGLPEDFLLDTIRESVLPAYKAVKDFLETEYKPHARANAGIFGLPDHERVYNDLIYLYTSVRYTADELHQKGLDEVARIRKRMEAIKDKVFEGTLAEFFVALKDKERFPQLYFANADEEAVPAYKAMIERINKKMSQYFNKFPKFPCAVEAVPKEGEAADPMAYYRSGTADKAGTFYANVSLLKESPHTKAMALVLHEAIPGHHHERSLALETPRSHPFFKTIFITSYLEGWGLYAEYLGEEMGMYDTDFDLFGRLEMEMHRALRLVVDTGLHAKNWTIDQCVEYMKDNMSMSEAEIVSEVKRYSIMPGQALAYKVGEIKILALRKKAETALGDKFDIRAFHEVVLRDGPVRLDTLEKNVDEWIASVKAQFPEYFELRTIMDEYMETNHKCDPVEGPIFGIYTFQDDIFNMSPEFRTWYVSTIEGLLTRINSIDAAKLDAADRATLELVKGKLGETLLWETCYDREIPASHMGGGFVDIFETLQVYQSLKTVKDAENLKQRLRKFPERFAGVIERFRIGIAKGITLPAESISLMVGKLEGYAVEDPKQSQFYGGFKDQLVAVGLSEDFLLDTIRESVLPAYKAAKEFIDVEYKPHARANAGIFGLPDHERVYNDLIFSHTSVRYTAEELHQKGLEEVARIRKRMEAIKDKVFEGTLAEFFVALKDKERFPQLYFANADEEALPVYKAMIERIDKKMPQFFNKFPKFPCAVEAVPKPAEASMPIAYYRSGTADKAGTFYANVSLLKQSPHTKAMALVLHEAIPGHHHERSLALETPRSHPFFKTIFITSYLEGWGLYAEYLGEEMGMYDTDFDLFGRLEMEMHRALRLVVDTGLHAKNWTIDQCVEYMKDNMPMSEAEIVSEVKRYSIMPGQALAYKVGEIKILALRKKAETALGDKFDIRAFHEVVLRDGPVRLDTLEKNVDEWIVSVLAPTAAA
ncbi:hypothetical protein HK105_202758 [Polyrhizophydium stewartii]|uniref:Uncharacterized protein n=1 Tax=Polyrhizophydium stewartii TaxID=2732419 RepID=A0ABR4NEC3_9FUNG|nr:hypothetical protein HK105_007762 [Polyrhizophydium stewartii]